MVERRVLIGSVLTFLLIPCIVAGAIPWWITGWQMQPASDPIRYLGSVLILLPLPSLIDSFGRFAEEGLGTPAPFMPTRHLVVTGAYSRVRNPMYLAVLCLILGQALLFASVWLAVYGLALGLTCHMFVLIYEEPTLLLQFGTTYRTYRKAVPRWIPLAKPWRGT